ncbi:hypothetical protein BHE74_00008915 [Ensete ventricosum]|uniref:Uncharacterized protein n=1 Tax=Ensete ventricosum TaxID=4639 RepID=A0A444D7K7_ENSVE|nr:hypothetical protein B296_00041763 [Ensete ventricosum]RWV94089.1 hypothetical protein GW17_00043410 [Ensete ventricosum]RWW82600.1 hypothetical protein BHE74_00008915 [Ensete ventricosum]RZR87581.1 hypothetical protein BHM03_00015030 [Ensete ventricosum]
MLVKAYTMELEAEVAKLKELNQELQKKQVEMMEMKKNQLELSGPAGDQAAAWTKETTVEEDTNRSMVKWGLDDNS